MSLQNIIEKKITINMRQNTIDELIVVVVIILEQQHRSYTPKKNMRQNEK